MSNSVTPRTDKSLKYIYAPMFVSEKIEVVESSLARQLERELNEARAEIDRKNTLIRSMLEAMRDLPIAQSTEINSKWAVRAFEEAQKAARKELGE